MQQADHPVSDGAPDAPGPPVFVLTVPAADAEVAADRLWQVGVRGVEERAGSGAAPQPDDRGVGRGSSSGGGPRPGDVGGHRSGDALVELRTSLGRDPAGVVAAQLRLEPGWHWRTERPAPAPAVTWRDHALPVRIADRIVVKPAWQEGAAAGGAGGVDPAGGLIGISIEPGAAFGLGDHPTTVSSLEAMVEIFERERVRTVLDVGSGTGVLSIGAAVLGAESVRAVDHSRAAVEATADNARRNGVDELVRVDGSSCADLEGPHDLVVANILAPVLIELAEDLRRLTAPTGRLVISGVLTDRYDHVLEALGPMVVERVVERDGWAAVTLRHDVAAPVAPPFPAVGGTGQCARRESI